RIGVEGTVANVLESAAVERGRPGFFHHADDAAGVAAVLGIVVVDEDAKFLDGVGIGIEHEAVAEEVVIFASVEQIGDGIGAAAADAEGAGAAAGAGSRAGGGHYAGK